MYLPIELIEKIFTIHCRDFYDKLVSYYNLMYSRIDYHEYTTFAKYNAIIFNDIKCRAHDIWTILSEFKFKIIINKIDIKQLAWELYFPPRSSCNWNIDTNLFKCYQEKLATESKDDARKLLSIFDNCFSDGIFDNLIMTLRLHPNLFKFIAIELIDKNERIQRYITRIKEEYRMTIFEQFMYTELLEIIEPMSYINYESVIKRFKTLKKYIPKYSYIPQEYSSYSHDINNYFNRLLCNSRKITYLLEEMKDIIIN